MSKSFQTKLNRDGTENPKYVDLLEEDKPISGQKFVCLSFNALRMLHAYLKTVWPGIGQSTGL